MFVLFPVNQVVCVPEESLRTIAEMKDGVPNSITSLTPWVTWRRILWEDPVCPRVLLWRRCELLILNSVFLFIKNVLAVLRPNSPTLPSVRESVCSWSRTERKLHASFQEMVAWTSLMKTWVMRALSCDFFNGFTGFTRTRFWFPDSESEESLKEIFLDVVSRLWRFQVFLFLLYTRERRRSRDHK